MAPSLAPQSNGTTYHEQTLPEGTVLIAGGGPVGLLLATVLSHYGVKSVLYERNQSTTRWPKMDLTNSRSMEIFRRLGLADALRAQGVPSHIEQPVLISSGLAAKEPITRWDVPGVATQRKQIQERNDGTQPLEPSQRVSQVIFEKWLNELCDKDPLIDLHFGWKVDEVVESADKVKTTVTNGETGQKSVIYSGYVAGCDGASSRTRQSLGLPLDGGPIPSCVLLVHFKSTDLARLRKQGQFWHIFLLGESGNFGGALIAQNEVDIWTTHLFLPLDVDTDNIESHDAVYKVLGGLYGPYPIKIDDILVRSVWRPNIAVARAWAGPHRRVFIAGDAAHQNIPTGGYGMNMGIGEAYNLGWKLAAVINGQAGATLLESYEGERRPVTLRNVERSGIHFNVHTQLEELLAKVDPHLIDEDTEEARKIRARIHEHYQTHDGENKDLGIEMGYRYRSPVIVPEEDAIEPEWTPSRYVPSTWPGVRAPHIFLSDGTAIFDKLDKDWTLLSFAEENCGQQLLLDQARALSVPLSIVDLSSEKLAKDLYEKRLVLIRPDEHVAWRGDQISDAVQAEGILNVVTGRGRSGLKPLPLEAEAPQDSFSATIGLTTQVGSFDLEKMGAFQQ